MHVPNHEDFEERMIEEKRWREEGKKTNQRERQRFGSVGYHCEGLCFCYASNGEAWDCVSDAVRRDRGCAYGHNVL